MKCLIIYTPYSLKGKAESKLPLITFELSKFYTVVTKKTEYEKHGTIIAKEACGIYDLIVIAGGDGLVNEVVNGLVKQENKPKVAVLPFGTVNDFAKSLGMKRNLKKNLDIILTADKKQIDLMKTNKNYACYITCAGSHTESTYLTRHNAKSKLGWFAYFLMAIKTIFKPLEHEFKVKLENKTLNGTFDFFMAINSKSVAGFKLNKKAVLDDGFIDIILFKKEKAFSKKIAKYFNLISFFLFGINSVKNRKLVIVSKVKEATITNLSLSAFNVDGEKYQPGEIMQLSVVKKEITFICK